MPCRSPYIDKKSKLWGETKAYLASLSHDKCWYCETKLERAHFHVDHFRPKNRVKNDNSPEEPGYWWLAFDVGNYRLSCPFCNSPTTDPQGNTLGKWDQFPLEAGTLRIDNPNGDLSQEVPLLLDPTRLADPDLLAYTDNGDIQFRNGCSDFEQRKVTVSIKVLNLREVKLTEARKRIWRECMYWVDVGSKAHFLKNQTNEPDTLQVAEELLSTAKDRIQSHIAQNAEYSAMARYCFKGTGEDWVLNLL